MNMRDESRKSLVVSEVLHELARAERKFPDQTLPWGGHERWAVDRDAMRALTNDRLASGTATWVDVIREEYYEGIAEPEFQVARAELIQLAAMCIRTILDCDQKPHGLPPKTFAMPRGPAISDREFWQETHGEWPPEEPPLQRRTVLHPDGDGLPAPNAGSVE